MPIISGYGYKIPIASDESSVDWMPNDTFNWTRMSDHRHDGNDSRILTGAAFTKVYDDLEAADWTDDGTGTGTYYQDVALPLTFIVDNTFFKFVITSGLLADYPFSPDIVKTGGSSYRIFSNDNTIDVRCYYL